MPGVKAVIALKQGIAVCADSFWNALQGKKALQVKWSKGSRPGLDSREVEKALLGGLSKTGIVTHGRGSPARALAGAAQRVEARYLLPYLAHAVPEPINCTALFTGTECRIWAPTQFQTMARRIVAKLSGLGPDKVQVHTTLAGGGFGRRFEADVVIEAVLLAKRFKGSPVQVAWPREDDLAHDVYRPGNACHIQAGLDAKGRLVAWKHKLVLTSIMSRFWPSARCAGASTGSPWKGRWTCPTGWTISRLSMWTPSCRSRWAFTARLATAAPW